jgi:hypothetical protein
VAATGVDRRGARAVGRDVRVRHRPGHLRPRHRPCHERLPAVARRPRAGDRARALVTRTADARARAVGSSGSSRRSRRTSACSTSCIPGRATSSCRSSRWPMPGCI